MAATGKRKTGSASNSRLNFRTNLNDPKWEPKGTKPTTAPTSVQEILTLMVLHICKKSIFFDTNLKVAFYLGALFLVSLISDFLPVPKTYFSRSDNVFNRYFVKFAWGWNLILLVPFVILTSLTYCCGNIKDAIKKHASRIVIATFFWMMWIRAFNYIEATYGKCNAKGDQFATKIECLKGGYFWHGFDLSGHSFILVYGSLVLIEEARVIIGWDNIKEYLRTEEHYRNIKDTELSMNPLKNITNEELLFLKRFYEKFTPYIRYLFVAMTILQILWDVMLITTMMYYHIMIEKFLGGVIAILTWFFTYRFWFTLQNVLPDLPGEGTIKYKDKNIATFTAKKRSNSSLNSDKQIPRFMGMPLYTKKKENAEEGSENIESVAGPSTR